MVSNHMLSDTLPAWSAARTQWQSCESSALSMQRRLGKIRSLKVVTCFVVIASVFSKSVHVGWSFAASSFRGNCSSMRGDRCHRAAGPRDVEAVDDLLKQAEELRADAEAKERVLRAEKAVNDPTLAASKELLEAQERLENVISPQLRKAEAFKLPELDELRTQARQLEKEIADLEESSAPAPAAAAPAAAPVPAQAAANPWNQSPPASKAPCNKSPEAQQTFGYDSNGVEKRFGGLTFRELEDLATKAEKMSVDERFELGMTLEPEVRRRLNEITDKRDEVKEAERKKREEAENAERKEGEDRSREIEEEETQKRVAGAKERARELAVQLTFENLKSMSNEERLALAPKLGNAFVLSLALVAVVYWSVTLPIFAYSYKEATGAWPAITDLFDGNAGGNAAGAVAGIASVALLLKPVRFIVALLITPWTIENVQPYLPSWVTGDNADDKK